MSEETKTIEPKKESVAKKKPTKTEMLMDVFTMARQYANSVHPTDRIMMASLLNFEEDMISFLKEKESK